MSREEFELHLHTSCVSKVKHSKKVTRCGQREKQGACDASMLYDYVIIKKISCNVSCRGEFFFTNKKNNTRSSCWVCFAYLLKHEKLYYIIVRWDVCVEKSVYNTQNNMRLKQSHTSYWFIGYGTLLLFGEIGGVSSKYNNGKIWYDDEENVIISNFKYIIELACLLFTKIYIKVLHAFFSSSSSPCLFLVLHLKKKKNLKTDFFYKVLILQISSNLYCAAAVVSIIVFVVVVKKNIKREYHFDEWYQLDSPLNYFILWFSSLHSNMFFLFHLCLRSLEVSFHGGRSRTLNAAANKHFHHHIFFLTSLPEL